MSTISTTTHRPVNMNIFIVLISTLVATLAFAVVSFVATPKPSLPSVARSQNVYVDFLRGEKQVFASSVGLGAGFSIYLAGEKTLNMNAVDASNVLWVYRLGEKSTPASIESALLQYRIAEKSDK